VNWNLHSRHFCVGRRDLAGRDGKIRAYARSDDCLKGKDSPRRNK